jgi:hypothetical protein
MKVQDGEKLITHLVDGQMISMVQLACPCADVISWIFGSDCRLPPAEKEYREVQRFLRY